MAKNNNGNAVAIVGGGLVAGAVDIAVATVIYDIHPWTKTLQAVAKGRAKISGRHELDVLADTDLEDPAFPE